MSSTRSKIKAMALPGVIAALAVLGTASPSMAQYGSGGYSPSTYGSVTRCNLSGVNPAAHPEVFGNPTIAATYGFVQKNGSWSVAPGCKPGSALGAATAAFAAEGKGIVAIGEPVKGGAGPGGLIMSNGLCWVQNGGRYYRWGMCPGGHY
jgi:hypothetical protein